MRMAVGGEYIVLQDVGIEEQTVVLNDSFARHQNIPHNENLASGFFRLSSFTKLDSDTCERVRPDVRVSCVSTDSVNDTHSVKNINAQGACSTSDDQRAVTHIEIIKASRYRRFSGANRVVPLLTNSLKALRAAKSNGHSGVTLAELYRTFLYDEGNGDSNRKCDICGQECLSCPQLENHLKSVHEMQEVTSQHCFVCQKKYIFPSQLHNHLFCRHGIQNPELICKTCFMEFNTTSEQKAHERKHDQTYSCPTCGDQFASEYLCQKHVQKHLLLPKSFECANCGKRFNDDIQLKIHDRRHLQLECNVCGFQSPDELSTLIHVRSHNSESIEMFLNNVAREDQNECELEKLLTVYNKQGSKSRSVLLDSEETSPLNEIEDCVNSLVSTVCTLNKDVSGLGNGLECKICGATVSCGKDLLDHQRQDHMRNRTCPFCGKRNQSVSQTWRHMRTHILQEKKSALNMSSSQQPSDSNEKKSSLSKRKRKLKERPLSCSLCCRDSQTLKQSGDERGNWKCAECELVFSHPKLLSKSSKTFEGQGVLEDRLMAHFGTKERKMFKCTLCPVMCPTMSGLIVHMRCHTGERPYTCGICDRKFRRVQAAKKHFQVVHNRASLEFHCCPSCRKGFTSSGSLTRHYLRVHCQLRRYICGVCGSRFSQNQDLQKHFKGTHQLEMPNIPYTDRKALKEIYVIPGVDDLPDTNPLAVKIKQIVDEEKAKFDGVAELLKEKSIKQKGAEPKAESQLLLEELVDVPGLPPLQIRPVSQDSVFYIDTSGAKEVSNEGNKGSVGGNSCEVNLYSCQYCGEVFVGENLFMEHLEGRSKLVCEKCGTIFCSEALLEEHVNAHHMVFQCHVCSELFIGKELFVNHLMTVEGLAVVENVQTGAEDKCSMEGSEISDLQYRNTNCAVDNFGGAHIQYSSQFSESLKLNNILLPNIVLQPNTTILQSFPFTIPTGDIVNSAAHVINVGSSSDVSTLQNLSSYIQTDDFVTNSASDMQDVLNVEVDQYTAVGNIAITSADDQGMETKDILNPNGSSANSKNICKTCGEKFRNPSALSYHRKSHAAVNKPFVCAQCGKHFSVKHNLKMHTMIHTGERPYKCEECGKHLRYRKDVLDHKRMHSGEKTFGCEQCGRKFVRQRELIRHRVIHTGEKKYKCPVCNKAFGRLDQLKHAHLPTHVQQQPHVCAVCNKGFRLKSKLKRHEVLHTGLKKYQCHLCEKSFALEPYLRTHLQFHQKRDSYLPCPKCPRKFRNEGTLQVHDKTFHSRICKSREKEEHSVLEMKRDCASDVDCGAVIYLQMGQEKEVTQS